MIRVLCYVFPQNTAHIDSVIRVDLFPALLDFPFASVSQKHTAMKSGSTHSIFIEWALERGNWLGVGNERIHVESNATEDPRETLNFLPEMHPCGSGKCPVTLFASIRVGVRIKWVSTCQVLNTALNKCYLLFIIFPQLPASSSLPNPTDFYLHKVSSIDCLSSPFLLLSWVRQVPVL